MTSRVAVLGAGAWGMAVSYLLTSAGNQVLLWEVDSARCARLRAERSDDSRLKGFRLPETVSVTDKIGDAVHSCRIVVSAVPAQRLRSAMARLGDLGAPAAGIVNLAKGIEVGSQARMSQVIAQTLGIPESRIVTLSGPSHAEEVIRDLPTAVVAAGRSEELVAEVQHLFSTASFRVYGSRDIVGVELGGSLKNIIAIASGIASGLGLGDNTQGALLTRGLAEIVRLGGLLGAEPQTFAGLSGIGDLVTTCYSQHSRNRYVGEQVGLGRSLAGILSGMSQIAEGVDTTRATSELADRLGVEMPITAEIYAVLFDGKPPAEAVGDLMGRALKKEVWF